MDSGVPHSQAEGYRRLAVLLPLARQAQCSRAQVREAAAELGLSERQVFTLIKRLRQANGDPASLARHPPSGGRGQTRLDPVAEEIIQAVIAGALQAEARSSVPDLVAEVRRCCQSAGVVQPSANTLRRRLAVLNVRNASPADSDYAESGGGSRTKQLSIHERDLDLLAALYEGAGQSDGWDRFISALTATYAGGKGGFVLHDPSIMEGFLPVAAGIEEDYWHTYNEHYAAINPWMARVATRPVGLAAHADSLVSRSDMRKTEFYNDWLRPAKLETGNSVTLQRDGSRFMIVSVLYPYATAEKDGDAVTRLQRLAPHMLRVSQLNRQISLLNARALAAETGLGSHHTALFVVNGSGKVVHHDALAEKLIEAGDGLRMLGNVLEAIHPAENRSLRKMIDNAVQASRAIAVAPGGTMRVTRQRARMPFEVLVSPLSAPDLLLDRLGSFAAVFVRAPQAASIPSASQIQLAYRLTAAEARLMTALLTEDTLETASERFDISKETARSQLKAIFQKTGTKNQVELVRLGLRGAPDMQSSPTWQSRLQDHMGHPSG